MNTTQLQYFFIIYIPFDDYKNIKFPFHKMIDIIFVKKIFVKWKNKRSNNIIVIYTYYILTNHLVQVSFNLIIGREISTLELCTACFFLIFSEIIFFLQNS